MKVSQLAPYNPTRPGRGTRAKERFMVGDPDDRHGFVCLARQYLGWAQSVNYARSTIQNREMFLDFFILWCAERDIYRPNEVNRSLTLRYQRYLYNYRKKDGSALSFHSQNSRLGSVSMFFRWLSQNQHIEYNPFMDIRFAKVDNKLPGGVLSGEEIAAIFSQPDLNSALGVRDRSMMELMYASGLRRGEILGLVLSDVDFNRRTLILRETKNHLDRLIPTSERALEWLNRYLVEVRPLYLRNPGRDTVFLSAEGTAISRNRLSQLVKDYKKAAGIDKRGACHLFRHSCATHMLENGADLRHIQELLGHKQVTSTQVYTRVAIRHLQDVYGRTHPNNRKKEHKPDAGS